MEYEVRGFASLTFLTGGLRVSKYSLVSISHMSLIRVCYMDANA
jgi:hypothetical protein